MKRDLSNRADGKGQRILIIGGVAGGASAAARLRRLDETADIVLLERGPDVSFANCGLPYFIGGDIPERSKLSLQTPDSLRNLLAIDVRAHTEATAIDREKKRLRIRNLKNGEEEDLHYDKLILSPGAAPLRPSLVGIDLPGIYTLRNLQDMDRIQTATQAARKALVVGAGFIGLEMAEQLTRRNIEVTLVELAEQVLPHMDPEMVRAVEQEIRDQGVNLLLGDSVCGFAQETDGSLQARLASGTELATDLVILSIGVRPESSLAEAAGLELGDRGHIRTNAYMQSSDPDIYAVGDVCENLDPILGLPSAVPLGGPANRQGRVAADHIVNGDKARPYPGTLGTAIVRVFDVSAGVTGYTEKRLRSLGVEFEKTIVTDFNHASYYPGASQLSVKILWEKATGRLLGGQVNGLDGVDKRLDVLATALKGGLTVDDLEHLELAYAPPFNAAKDPLNTAGFSANNIRRGLLNPIYERPSTDETQLIDARPAEMAKTKPIPGARNIPFPQMRSRLAELDRSRSVTTICALGKMSYFASRVLEQHGFEVNAHIGGWKIESRPQGSTEGTDQARPATPAASAGDNVIRLDATGTGCCQGPFGRIEESAARLEPGQILEIATADADFRTDFPAFCEANAYECLGVEKEKGILTGRLRKT